MFTDAVLKLIAPLFQGVYNVTCDNFLTSLNLVATCQKEVQPRRDNAPEQERSNGREQEEKGVALNRSVQARQPNSNYTLIIPAQSSKKRGNFEKSTRGRPSFSKKRLWPQYRNY